MRSLSSLSRLRCWNPLRVLVLLGLLAAVRGGAQTCWVYTDSVNAPTPIKCVQKFDHSLDCDWNDGLSDCTVIPVAGPQTIRQMHEIWHQCFGGVGGATPPAGRSARWYAFHRQFELDFNRWRTPIGFAPIESLEWCPNMNLPVGTGPVVAGHPAGCGTGTPRPDDVSCPQCVAFPQCLFHAGGGPAACPNSPSSNCQTPDGSVSFPYASLDQFQDVDEVAKILDGQFHGIMHFAIGVANRTPAQGCNFGVNPPITNGCFNLDSLGSDCSPRDPMFWRLHKALDDVVRAWQDSKAVDVVIIVDRSGSMSDPDSGGGTKLAAALSAVQSFADLVDSNRSDAQVNRVGIVSYSDNSTLDMPLTVADASLGTPIANAVASISAAGPGGCTGIGGALQKAVEELCPPGDCRNFSASGDNDRKAILLLTDGYENIAPCLHSAGATGSGCGTQCFGTQFDLDKLEFTQLVAVGFGNGATLNGPLLTTIAERQGGVYLQNPNAPGPGNDLKDFFAKAFGQLSSEFLLVDPHGTLAANQAATEVVPYDGCADATLTFVSGWNQTVAPGELSLLIEAPSGDLVRGSDPAVEASRKALWDFSRVRLPYHGARDGRWRAQIVRPHQAYVNGFPPDAFAVPEQGVRLVRREIQRLCPEGCGRVLLFEEGRLGAASAYEKAVAIEAANGLLGAVHTVGEARRFAREIERGRWDLVVYAQMGRDRRLPYDAPFSRLLCAGQRAILTELRRDAGAPLLRCAGAFASEPFDWHAIQGAGRLVDQAIKLVNPGYRPLYTYSVRGLDDQAFSAVQSTAVGARVAKGVDQNWFVDVLGSTLGKLSPQTRQPTWKTGAAPLAMVRMLPSYVRSGGWDSIDARVEVEYPRQGYGAWLARNAREGRQVGREFLSPIGAALESSVFPTATATFPLYDDGTHRDLNPGNFNWTAELSGLGRVDGAYKLRFLFDLEANGCKTHRELVQTMVVQVGVDPKATKVTVDPGALNADGWRSASVVAIPRDVWGNLLGPGRAGSLRCAPKSACRLDGEPKDLGDGRYEWSLATAPGTASVRIDGWDTSLSLPLDCPTCPTLASLAIAPEAVVNQQAAVGVVELSAPAPRTIDGGAVVFLATSDRRLASVPESVVVPAGKTRVEFPITVFHVHHDPERVEITATYGEGTEGAALKVSAPDHHAHHDHGLELDGGGAKIPPGYYLDHAHPKHDHDE